MLVCGCRDGSSSAADTDGPVDTDGSDAPSSGTDDGTGDSDTEGGASACEEGLAPRQLRLLTRREYDATVRDLFSLVDPQECEVDEHCLPSASCQAGACMQSSVEPTAFVLSADGASHGSVHVAGSFNGWPGTIAAGGWPLDYDPATDSWSGTFDIEAGSHEYKLVIDETTWIADPTNPQTVPDGVGGSNSVLVVSETQTEVPPRGLDFAADIPPETRPDGFPFDDDAASGLVTSVHAQIYMRAAHDVARLALAAPGAWLPCTPTVSDTGCAEQVAAQVGRRVFRRPLEADEAARYADLILDADDPQDGLETMLRAMLASPFFLYRFEIGEPEGDHFRLSPYEVAAALSYGLLGTTPDDELLDAAELGELDAPAGIESQARRLLEDPRARDLLGVFALQWLGVERIATADKNPELFPDFDAQLRAAMLEETRQFVGHVAFEGSGRFDELLTADYSVVDARLTEHYGSGAPEASGRVQLPADRRGLLGHASVLASYAYSDQTSPVRRGLFVRRRLLCQDLPDPPPDAGAVPEVDPNATTRERFDQHGSDPACSGCHQFIDPVGFGFEHFDPVGVWRGEDAGQPIDASGVMLGLEGLGEGEPIEFASLPELATVLSSSQGAPKCFVRQYFRFAHGRLEGEADDCAISSLEQGFVETDHDIIELVVATLTSPEYLLRGAP